MTATCPVCGAVVSLTAAPAKRFRLHARGHRGRPRGYRDDVCPASGYDESEAVGWARRDQLAKAGTP